MKLFLKADTLKISKERFAHMTVHDRSDMGKLYA